MCRNIRTLHNFLPPATDDEVRASAIQFVRKLSGFTRPSKANQIAFNSAVEKVAEAAQELLAALVTDSPPRNRAVEALKAERRAAQRFGLADRDRSTAIARDNAELVRDPLTGNRARVRADRSVRKPKAG